MTGARRLLAIALSLALGFCAACSGSSMDNPESPSKELVIGLIVPQTGPYKVIGDDQLRGWDLYLKEHGNKLGGHAVKIVVADEGPAGALARTAADKLIKADRAVVLVGTADAQAVSAIAGLVTEDQIPLVGVGGRPSTLTDLRFIWHTSFLSTDYGQAVGAHVATNVARQVYVIGPDTQGGRDQLAGFIAAFTKAGGQLANPDAQPTYTPATADNFGPWLAQVKDSSIRADGALAVYAFYAGPNAVAFVKQYEAFGLKTVPLVGPAFLTEGTALAAEGGAADGIVTVANYAPGLSHPANQDFLKALAATHPGTTPNLYHVTAYDAAAVLDKAIASAGPDPSPQAINAALGKLAAIDSPRGSWSFNPATHTPVQHWYLRQVQATSGNRTNAVVADLGTR